MKLILASANPGKLAELQELFAPLGLELASQGTLGLAEADEPFSTFVENALAKARHAARASGGAAIADDSGLCVDALGGAPGVASAHYVTLPASAPASAPASGAADGPADEAAAPESPGDREARRRAQDAANNRLLLERLQGVTDRRASFVCTLVALRTADDPEPLVATGRWPGEVLAAPRGTGGFGYDPLVFIPALGKSVGELDAEAKNAVSHRARATIAMLGLLREAWHVG